jgi:hypothetical protein
MLAHLPSLIIPVTLLILKGFGTLPLAGKPYFTTLPDSQATFRWRQRRYKSLSHLKFSPCRLQSAYMLSLHNIADRSTYIFSNLCSELGLHCGLVDVTHILMFGCL